jgi:hypothetical protein
MHAQNFTSIFTSFYNTVINKDLTGGRVLHGAETWTLQAVDQKHFESFKI